ncbi:MAG: hypothetical protein A2233_05265 [Candidatus Kerfeldbacteria bacterium RIFOXYA2_FULL_38_24]|uniref:HTH arsR-type domain-containing protein n=1 Tax=Candidatus Kerfeldbacteria bacterium RIFOXYB2_FULL_38_14 TaxID=1798547 RepID=A0A1G2BGC8_9BACT|nr:MAG: hypothetical protein A2233_05265 [Candidatus Kerfeldbacteria bacterium RIFOXYA2_FULL_38_24]OGY88241.1 MAG: hypothetical protein A2319_03560 [Candidatus Kerfeldbacteria bacterium RIFOXYB2_FULL_38_14]OGY89435.1 MAG: hypothetical protein A2458_00615 [Candidatus Kerfeldbacteria bacterium RIFOXYC2_FULL_38_9]
MLFLYNNSGKKANCFSPPDKEGIFLRKFALKFDSPYNIVMLEKIFGSRTRVKLFRLFLTNEDKEFFVREISRTIDEQINSVRRELTSLEKVGILKSQQRDKKKYYKANKNFELFQELRSLILKARVTQERGFIQSIKKLGNIRYLALTGYFMNNTEQEVDLLIVGDISRDKLNKLLAKFKESFGTHLRFTVMPHEEYVYRKDVTDKFLYSIINSDKIVVVDNLKG